MEDNRLSFSNLALGGKVIKDCCLARQLGGNTTAPFLALGRIYWGVLAKLRLRSRELCGGVIYDKPLGDLPELGS